MEYQWTDEKGAWHGLLQRSVQAAELKVPNLKFSIWKSFKEKTPRILTFFFFFWDCSLVIKNTLNTKRHITQKSKMWMKGRIKSPRRRKSELAFTLPSLGWWKDEHTYLCHTELISRPWTLPHISLPFSLGKSFRSSTTQELWPAPMEGRYINLWWGQNAKFTDN